MNTKRFNDNLLNIQETLLKSKFLEHLQSTNYTYEMLSNTLIQVTQLAINASLSLEEIELKERELSLGEEKTRQEIELAVLNAKAQARLSQSEAVKSLVQAHSMVESIPQNAAINRANAYVGFLNVVGNASNEGAISEHSKNVIEVINQIVSKEIPNYKEILDKLKESIQGLIHIGSGSKEVFIYAPKLLLYVDEEIRLLGFSAYGNNPCRFKYEDKILESKSLIYTPKVAGEVEITFESQNDEKEWISDKLILRVIERNENE